MSHVAGSSSASLAEGATTPGSRRARGSARRRYRSIAALVLACLAAGCASTAARQSELLALERTWSEALRTHDTVALDRLLDDAFIDSTFRGALRSKRDVLSGPPAGGPYHSVRLDDLVVRFYDETAVVTGVNVVQGATAADTARVRFTDVFVRRHGRWRAVSAQETLVAGQ